jgi:hypothetical protein
MSYLFFSLSLSTQKKKKREIEEDRRAQAPYVVVDD